MKLQDCNPRPRGKLRMKVAMLFLCGASAISLLQACGATQIDHRGHVFTEVDLEQVQTGMSKDQVRLALGSPDTTGTVDGDVFYYISAKQRTRPMGRPELIEQKVLAVYFDQHDSVAQVANYGLQDGVIFDFIKGETPSRGTKLSALQQVFGNIANRRSIIQQSADAPPGTPGGGQ